MKSRSKGFTLVEVLAVISIIGVVVILLLPTTLNAFNKARGRIEEYEVEDIEDAAKMWIEDYDLKVKKYVYNEDKDYTTPDGKTYKKGQEMATYDFRVYAIERQAANNPIIINIEDLIEGKYYNEECNYNPPANLDAEVRKNMMGACKVSEECTISVGIEGKKVQEGLYWITDKYVAKASDKCK